MFPTELELLDGTKAPLRMPSIPHRFALNRALAKAKDDETAQARLTAAALGLAWASDQAPPPWRGGLADVGGDLAAFGDRVWSALEGKVVLATVDALGWSVLIAAISSLAPAKEVLEEARGNSEGPSAEPSPSASKSEPGTSEATTPPTSST